MDSTAMEPDGISPMAENAQVSRHDEERSSQLPTAYTSLIAP